MRVLSLMLVCFATGCGEKTPKQTTETKKSNEAISSSSEVPAAPNECLSLRTKDLLSINLKTIDAPPGMYMDLSVTFPTMTAAGTIAQRENGKAVRKKIQQKVSDAVVKRLRTLIGELCPRDITVRKALASRGDMRTEITLHYGDDKPIMLARNGIGLALSTRYGQLTQQDMLKLLSGWSAVQNEIHRSMKK